MSDSNVIGAFSEADASRLSGLSIGQLRDWDRSDFLRPAYARDGKHLPYGRVYSFRDIVSLRVLSHLRNVHGVSVQHLKQVSHKLAAFGDAKWTATTLYVLRKKVVFDDPRTGERVQIADGQRVFDIPLKVAIANTKRDIAFLNQREAEDAGRIVQSRFVMQNEPVFRKTRIPVAAVKRYIDAGFAPEAIIREYPLLTEDDVEAARAFEGDAVAA